MYYKYFAPPPSIASTLEFMVLEIIKYDSRTVSLVWLSPRLSREMVFTIGAHINNIVQT